MQQLVQLMKFAVVAALTAFALNGSAYADYTARTDVQLYIAELVEEYDFAESELTTLFQQAQRKDSILEAISRPAERTLKWHEYRQIFLKQPRIEQGLEFWARNEAILEQAQARYGVAPEYIVAIMGVETRYGRITGGFRVLDALATLAFDYPPRSTFFRRELTEFLLLSREEGKSPLELKGSYAGAMGYGQFIPSSFRAYAVDFDGDGLRDIWSSETDAIGSVANYFSRHGWENDQPVVLRVEVSAPAAEEIANRSLQPDLTGAELQALGVDLDTLDLGSDPTGALFRMELEDATEYWLGLNNFYVITRYNRSRLYALAVHQLSQAIKAERSQLTVQR